MKGIVFNILEDFIDENFGDNTFDTLVELVLPELDEPFVGPGTYSDEQLMAIVGKAIEVKKLELDPTLRAFGAFMFTKLASKYPGFVDPHDNPKDFIKTIHDIIHVEVRKLFPEAITPVFIYSNETENSLTLKYVSKRNLFALAEGLMDGSGAYYNKPFKIKRTEENREDNYCVFDLDFSA
jgi:hypothetical protein